MSEINSMHLVHLYYDRVPIWLRLHAAVGAHRRCPAWCATVMVYLQRREVFSGEADVGSQQRHVAGLLEEGQRGGSPWRRLSGTDCMHR